LSPAPKTTIQKAKIAKGRLALIAILALGLSLIGAALLVRYGAVTPQGRMFVEARTNGLKLGRIGRLRLEGVEGDIWRNFSVRRLTISDEKGVWLEADRLMVTWRSGELLLRRFHAETIMAQQVRILRRPTLLPKTRSRAAPVSVDLDRFAMRLVLEPAFSGRRGDYDVAGAYEMVRLGGQTGRFDVLSRLHAGDFLKADFDLGRNDTLKLNARAQEAAGGALAGALGFDPRQSFSLNATAAGTTGEGRFTVDAALGPAHPVKAAGAWNARGGSASGVVDLNASSLMRAHAGRFGREAKFTVQGTRAQDGLYLLNASVKSDNLSLTAQGLGDIAKRMVGPKGLTIAADIPNMSRIVAAPEMGAGQVRAVLRREGALWVLDGSAGVRNFILGGYRLARVDGPARLSVGRGEAVLTTRLAGQGGQGSGVTGALLGARPTLSVEAVRLKDGRILLRDIEGAGTGLRLSGEGARSLLGGLNFKGNVVLTNLESIRPDASGSLTAAVTASQGARGRPWQLNVNGRGANFASGLSELDRLLGPRPTLVVRGGLGGGSLSLANASLKGESAQAEGAGIIAKDRLALNIDWTAAGPFRAGPVEIGGAAKGVGSLTGSLNAPALKLVADFESVALPRLPLTAAHLELNFRRGASGSDGDATLTATSAYGPARAASAFRFAEGGLDLTGLDADAGGVQAKGDLSLRRSAPSRADLTVNAGPGVLLTSGRITGSLKILDGAAGPNADVALNAENAILRDIDLRLASARISGSGPLANLPLKLEARGVARPGRWQVTLDGRLSSPSPGTYGLSLEGAGELGRSRVSTREAAMLRLEPGRRAARLRLTVGDGAADIDLMQQAEAVSLTAVLTGADLGALNEDLSGDIDARLVLNGKGETLGGTLQAAIEGARERGAPMDQSLNGQINAILGGGQLQFNAAAQTIRGLKADAQFSLPAAASARPLRLAIDRTRPMAGRFQASGQVKPLWDLLVGGERSLTGVADVEMTLGGTLADPRVSGRGDLAQGVFEDGATGLKLTNVALKTVLSQTGVELRSLTADDGFGGRLAAGGRLDLTRGAESSLKLNFFGFRLIDNATGEASASGETTLSRDADGRLKLAGALTIDRADLSAATPTPSGVVVMDVIERNRPADLQPDLLRAPAPRGAGMAFDLTFSAPRRVFVRGRGLDMEMSLNARLEGNSNAPLLSGVARVVRGEYDFAGKRFEFDDSGAVYLATNPNLIRLDLTAVREDPALTATVNIGGTAARPEITLSSSPALPSDEVLSQVLFGASAAQLSPLEAAQLASALAALSGGGGLDVIGNLRSFARLDRLAFAGDAAGGMTVAGGKYVTDDVYLEIIGGGREGPVAQVEWRIRRTLSLVSRFSGSQDSRLSVRWRRDY
jgi:translocation and assembly module TamB